MYIEENLDNRLRDNATGKNGIELENSHFNPIISCIIQYLDLNDTYDPVVGYLSHLIQHNITFHSTELLRRHAY